MLAIYTCFFGNDKNWANVVLHAIEGVDCYYFTNNATTFKYLSAHGWNPVWVNIPISDDNMICSEQTKHLRCCPWEYPELACYTYLCWVDSKLRITDVNKLLQMVDALTRSDAVWAFTSHPTAYTDVWGEYTAAIQYEKYARQKESYKSYIESRLLAGYNDRIPQRVSCGFSIRKMTPLAKEIGSFWLSEIRECGIEDQISFQFVHQKYDTNIVVFPYQFCWSHLS